MYILSPPWLLSVRSVALVFHPPGDIYFPCKCHLHIPCVPELQLPYYFRVGPHASYLRTSSYSRKKSEPVLFVHLYFLVHRSARHPVAPSLRNHCRFSRCAPGTFSLIHRRYRKEVPESPSPLLFCILLCAKKLSAVDHVYNRLRVRLHASPLHR